MGLGGGAQYRVPSYRVCAGFPDRRYVAAVGRAGSSQVPILMTRPYPERVRMQKKAYYQQNRDRLKEASRLRYYQDKINEARKRGC